MWLSVPVHAETLRAIRRSAVQDADAALLLYACGKRLVPPI
jgi:hypothetical protein